MPDRTAPAPNAGPDTVKETPNPRMRAPRARVLSSRNRSSPAWRAPEAATYTLNVMPLSGWASTTAAPWAVTWAATAACIRAVVTGSGGMIPCAVPPAWRSGPGPPPSWRIRRQAGWEGWRP